MAPSLGFSRTLGFVAGMAVLGSAGCGTHLPPLAQVTGTVVFERGRGDVHKLKDANLQFQSESEPEDVPAAVIQEDGSFTVYCRVDKKTVPGIKEGKYKVRLLFPASHDPQRAPGNVVGSRYLNFKTTPLEYTIGPGEQKITVEVEGGR
jgi:hypothetical protein